MRVLLLPVALSVALVPAGARPDPEEVLKLVGEFGGGDVAGAAVAAYAPDGKTVYAAGVGPNGGRVLVIDVARGAVVTALAAPKGAAHPRYATAAAVSPDGKWLAAAFQLVASDRGQPLKDAGWEVQLWNLADRTLAARTGGAVGELRHLAFAADSTLLAGTSAGFSAEANGYEASAFVWTAPRLNAKQTVMRRGYGFAAVGLAAEDGATVLRVVDDRAIRIWDVATGKEAEPRPFVAVRVTAAAFSPDGRTLAVAGEPTTPGGKVIAGDVSLYDAAQGGKAWAVARGHAAGPERMAFSPDGRFLATTSTRSADAIVWDAENLAIQAEIPAPGAPAFSPDGETLALDGTAHWGALTGRHRFTLGRHPTQVWAVAFHPRGWSVASGQNAPVVRVWDARTLKNTVTVPLDPNGRTTRAVAFSPDLMTLAAVDGATVKLIKEDDGYVYATLKGHTSGVNAVAFSPDGKHVATASGTVRWRQDEPIQDAGEVIVWRWERGGEAKVVHTLKAHPNGTFALAWSPDGKTLATGGGDPPGGFVPDPKAPADAVKLWDAATGKVVRSFPCDLRHHVNALAWSADGKHLAHTGLDGTRVRVLDPATGAERARLDTPTAALAFSPDSALLATAGAGGRGNGEGLIELWDAARFRRVAAVVGHAAPVTGIAFGQGGAALASGSTDGVLNLWEVRR